MISKYLLQRISENFFTPSPYHLNQSYAVRLISRQTDRTSEYQKPVLNFWMDNWCNQRLFIVFSTLFINLISVFHCQNTKEPLPLITKNRSHITRWVYRDGVKLTADWIIKRDHVPPVEPLEFSPTNPWKKTVIFKQKITLTTATSALIYIQKIYFNGNEFIKLLFTRIFLFIFFDLWVGRDMLQEQFPICTSFLIYNHIWTPSLFPVEAKKHLEQLAKE